MPYELAALCAAFCWSIGGIISATPAKAIGGMNFTRIRMSIVFVMLIIISFISGGWSTISIDQIPIIVLSGFIGIFVGDTALFSTLSRLGPRRTSMLFSSNAPMTAIIGYFWLGETLSDLAIVGCGLVMIGVLISIRFGKNIKQVHHFEEVRGSLSSGIMLGLLAALGQSLGSILIKPIVASDADLITVATIRTAVAAGLLWILFFSTSQKEKAQPTKLNLSQFLQISASGIIGMGVGMTLLLYAFSIGDVGVSSVLSSTNPIILLPLMWVLTGERPANGAWYGALIAVIGTALILLR